MPLYTSVGLIVKEEVPDGVLVAMLEKSFHGKGVGCGTGLATTSHDGGFLVLAEDLQNVVRRGLIGRPSPVAPENLFLELLHARLCIPEDVQLFLQLRTLAAHLLPEGNGLDVQVPCLASVASGSALFHHWKLPKITEQNQARKLIRVLPHSQDPFEVRCREHGDLAEAVLMKHNEARGYTGAKKIDAEKERPLYTFILLYLCFIYMCFYNYSCSNLALL